MPAQSADAPAVGRQGTPLSRMAGPDRRNSIVLGRSKSVVVGRPASAPVGAAGGGVDAKTAGGGGDGKAAGGADVPLPALVDALASLSGITEVRVAACPGRERGGSGSSSRSSPTPSLCILPEGLPHCMPTVSMLVACHPRT